MGMATTKYGRRKGGLKNSCKRLPLNVFMLVYNVCDRHELATTITNFVARPSRDFSF
jgi:hypothetical protein